MAPRHVALCTPLVRRGCRDAYVRMEALRTRGEMLIPSSVASPGGALTFTFSTPSDLAAFLARVQDEVLNPEGRGVGSVRRRRVAPGSEMLAVFELLSNSKQGVDREVAGRLMDSSSEYDAGRYALLLRRGGDPVATATFNVLGPGLPAQASRARAATLAVLHLKEVPWKIPLGLCLLTCHAPLADPLPKLL